MLGPLLSLRVGYKMLPRHPSRRIRTTTDPTNTVYLHGMQNKTLPTRCCHPDGRRRGRLNRGLQTQALPRNQGLRTIAAAAAPSRGQSGGCQANA